MGGRHPAPYLWRIGRPEKNPMFLEKRVYQGSSGVVYPYPVIEKIEDTCEEKSYHAVWLENEYIKAHDPARTGRTYSNGIRQGKATAFYLLQSRNKAGTGRTHRSLDLREALSSTGLNITVPAPSCRWTTASNDVKTEVSLYG